MDYENIPLKIVVAGHVDDGKSTLIGRLLYETHSLQDGKLEELEKISTKRGMPLEWSFVLDAFQAERDQAITIDTSHIRLKTKDRDIVIIDAPGHIEFLKNMISAAANADAAFLLIDATEGLREQTRRHTYLLQFLGIRQITVLINKMDLVNYAENTFNQIKTEVARYFADLNIQNFNFIPISARHGDMLVTHSANMPWYHQDTVLARIQTLTTQALSDGPLRFPVQDVYKFDARRIIAGRIESGQLSVGDQLLISPSNQTARVLSIEGWNSKASSQATKGQSIGITLDKQLFIERGDILSHMNDAPLLVNQFSATLFWLGQDPLKQQKTYKMKFLSREISVTIDTILHCIDIEHLSHYHSDEIKKNNCGAVVLKTQGLIPLDEYRLIARTGRFVLVDGYEIVAGGMISLEGVQNQRIQAPLHLSEVAHYVSEEQKIRRNGHKGGVLWLTGLSGAGKSTLAMNVERYLFQKGFQVYTLDGDNIRKGLNANLGFSPEDRRENIRRIGEVAALFREAGFICITSFISPYQFDRDMARKMLPTGDFHEIYIKANLATCENRDPKGLYKKARTGKIAEFTGVSAPYETPLAPELVINTEVLSIEESVNLMVEYVMQQFSLDLNSNKTELPQNKPALSLQAFT